MRAFNRDHRGLEVRELPGLAMKEPPDNTGAPRLIRPGDVEQSDFMLSTFRTVGQRKMGSRWSPLMHAQLALLGHLRWWEDDEFGSGFRHGFIP